MTENAETARPHGTHQEQIVFLTTRWGSRYTFAAPEAPGGRWTATANFGRHDRIQGFSAAELLDEVYDHYQVHKAEGSTADRS